MRVFITGGAGFIGSNVAEFHIDRGDEVIILDDLSRDGTKKNLKWVRGKGKIDFFHEDIRSYGAVKKALRKTGKIDLFYHFAAQVAVTTSVSDPRKDFTVNALGAFNVLEAIRETGIDPVIIFSSTNKVYGEMPDVRVVEKDGRYAYRDLVNGVPESRQLDFHSPYGCSKGCADQYFIDYARIYGLRTVVLRQSCIYGPRQYGVEDQGWVAWFIIAVQSGRNLTIYGDGKQVRDILYVKDLLELYLLVYKNIEKIKGSAFNVGGGEQNQMSLLELLSILARKSGENIAPGFDDWRSGDQKIYVSDISKVKKVLGWEPKIGMSEGIDLLWDWVREQKEWKNRTR